jgi:tight adherence protein C
MSTETYILIGILVVGGIAAALIYVGQRIPKDEQDPMQARLEEFSQRGEAISLEDIEMSQPFQERVVYPLLKRFGEIAARFTPQNSIQDITKKLELSGAAGRFDAPTIFASRFVFAIIFFFLGTGMFMLPSVVQQATSRAILIGVGVGIFGFFLPPLLIDNQIGKRQKEIRKGMPDALDLLTICVEAGLGFDAAMSKVAEKWDNELSMAFGRTIREIQLGKTRREAMRDMADRVGIAEMTSFVAAVVQSEQLGVSMSKVLHIQADQMRMKRRQYAEEEAHKAPIKMLVPMAIFIFPSIFIVLMTPAVIRMMGSSVFGG